MSVVKSRAAAAALRSLSGVFLLALTCGLISCGGDSEEKETKTFQKKESVTMEKEGTAQTEEEKERRVQSMAEKKAAMETNRRLGKALTKLSKAKDDSFEIVEALALFEAEGEAARPHLEKIEVFLANEDLEVRAQALKTVSQVKGKEGKADLLFVLRNADEDAFLRTMALEAWQAAGYPADGTIEGMLDDFDDGIQREALTVILKSDMDAGRLKFLKEKMPELSGAAVKKGLAYIKENREAMGDLKPMLIALFDHQDGRARAMAVQITGDASLKSRDMAQNLLGLMRNDPDFAVRKEAHTLFSAWAGSGAALPPFDPKSDDEKRYKTADALKEWFAKNESLFP